MIYSTCIYLKCHDEVLFLLRNKKNKDINHGKYIGIGGKTKDHESARLCAIRETEEETGILLNPLDLKYRGIVYFYVDHKLSEKIWLYTIELDEKPVLPECNEGTFYWVKKDLINNLNLWEGDRTFISRVVDNQSEVFTICLYYDLDGNLVNYIEREKEDE